MDVLAHGLVGVVMLDFSAAFDLVDHEILLRKSEYHGFSSSALLWMGSYLSMRKQVVFFNGNYSASTNVHCGVPQGTLLPRSAFILYFHKRFT